VLVVSAVSNCAMQFNIEVTYMLAVADYGSSLSQSQGKYAVSSSQRAERPTHPTHSNMPGRSYSSLSSQDIREIGVGYGMDTMNRARAFESVEYSLSSQPLDPLIIDPASTWCDSLPSSSSFQLMLEPDTGNCFRGSPTSRVTVSNLHSLQAGSSSDFILIDNCRSSSSVPRSRRRSPVSKSGQPSIQRSSASSVPFGDSHNRRVRSPEAGSRNTWMERSHSASSVLKSGSRSPVSNYGQLHRHSFVSSVPGDVSRNQRVRSLETGSGDILSESKLSRSASLVPVAHSHSPISNYSQRPSASSYHHSSVSSGSGPSGDVSHNRRVQSPEAGNGKDFLSLHCSSVNDVSDDVQYLRGCPSAVDQPANSRKRQRQPQPQQQPAGNNSSLLFAKKLAKLRELRYIAYAHKIIFYCRIYSNRTVASQEAISS